MEIKVTVPIAPVPWSRPRFNSRSGAVFNANRYSEFKKEFSMLFTRAMKIDQQKPLSGALSLSATFYIPKPKTVKREYPSVVPDLDNYIKGIQDGMNKLAYKDDAQIIKYLNVSKRYADTLGPRIVIEIKEIK